jgi:hypothetical protein
LSQRSIIRQQLLSLAAGLGLCGATIASLNAIIEVSYDEKALGLGRCTALRTLSQRRDQPIGVISASAWPRQVGQPP